MITTKFKKTLCMILFVVMCASFLLTGCESSNTPPAKVAPDTVPTVSDTVPGETTAGTSETTETTTTTTSPALKAETPAGMSDDPFSYQVSIDGNVIQLPCNVADLVAIGWTMEADKADNTLDENYTTSASFYNGDCRIVASIINTGDSAVKFSEATVDDLYFYDYSLTGHTIAVSNGLTFGSTKDDVIAVYGSNPSHEYSEDGQSYSSLTYRGADFYHKIEFAFRDDIVSSISIFTN